jgi:RNA polymerase sigma factor (sigma-70 family)
VIHHPNQPSRTTTSLLEGLHSPADVEAWDGFERRYRGLLVNFARKLGFDDADAADVAQETITRFLTAYRAGKYDRSRGRLRSWLVAIAQGRAAALRQRLAGRRIERGESAMVDLSDEADVSAVWEQQRRQEILRQAMEELRTTSRTDEKTIRAFELLCVNGLKPAVVADQMGMSVHDVYLAKSRVAQRLREIAARLESSYPE